MPTSPNAEIPHLTELPLKNSPHHLDLVVLDQADPIGTVEAAGNAWLDSLRAALASHGARDREEIVTVVKLIAYEAEIELYGSAASAALDELETGW